MTKLSMSVGIDLFERFPNLTVYGLRASGLRAALDGVDTVGILKEMTSTSSSQLKEGLTHPAVTSWREAYALMNVKPSKFRSSIESLLRRAEKGADLALPVPGVNLYNAFSIASRAAVGAYDLDRLASFAIELRRCNPVEDHFDPLGAESSSLPLGPNLIVYAVGNVVLCWGFNHRDSKDAALHPLSDQVAFFAEGAFSHQRQPALSALEGLKNFLVARGAACTEIKAADCTTPVFEI